MGSLLKGGQFTEDKYIKGDLNKILQVIKGTWGLMPNVGSLSNLY